MYAVCDFNLGLSVIATTETKERAESLLAELQAKWDEEMTRDGLEPRKLFILTPEEFAQL